MMQLLLIFTMFAFGFIVIERNRKSNDFSDARHTSKQYLSDFKMYLCLKNKLLLFPSKEICIDKKYYTLNLTTRSNILPHKNMISYKTFGKCTECLNRCIFGDPDSDVVDLKISFNEFKRMSNHDLKDYLKTVLTKEQYDYLFENKNTAE